MGQDLAGEMPCVWRKDGGRSTDSLWRPRITWTVCRERWECVKLVAQAGAGGEAVLARTLFRGAVCGQVCNDVSSPRPGLEVSLTPQPGASSPSSLELTCPQAR